MSRASMLTTETGRRDHFWSPFDLDMMQTHRCTHSKPFLHTTMTTGVSFRKDFGANRFARIVRSGKRYVINRYNSLTLLGTATTQSYTPIPSSDSTMMISIVKQFVVASIALVVLMGGATALDSVSRPVTPAMQVNESVSNHFTLSIGRSSRLLGG